jgi:flagellin
LSRISFGTNISSLVAQRRLGEASDQISEIQGRLSSGLRINKASDDSASLAVLSDLNVTSRVYTQGIRNLNDGVSLLSIADSTDSALTDIVTRTRELSAQAANGTYSNTQRNALDAEAQALSKEYTRIIQSSKFNNINLFDGSLAAGLRLQAGFGTDGGIFSTLGGAKGTGSFTVSATVSLGSNGSDVVLGDIDNDGDLDLVTIGDTESHVSLGNGDGTFSAVSSYSSGGILGYKGSLSDINNDGNLDLLYAGTIGGANRIQIRLGDGTGAFGAALTTANFGGASLSGFAIADLDNDGKLDAVTYSSSSAYVLKGNGDGTFNTAVAYGLGTNANYGNALQLADFNGDGILDIGGLDDSRIVTRLGDGSGGFAAAVSSTAIIGMTVGYALNFSDLDGDGKVDAVAAGMSGGNQYTHVLRGNGDGTFNFSVSYQGGTVAVYDTSLSDINGDGLADLVQIQNTGTNSIILRTGNGNGTFNTATSFNSISGKNITLGDVNADGVLDLAASGLTPSVPVYLNRSESGINPLLDFSLKTKSTARYAQSLFDQKLNQLSAQRGQIGAFQSRLSTALNSLTGIRDEYRTASARIGDADIAADAANLLRTQILQQAATAILAQANQAPALALVLLTG